MDRVDPERPRRLDIAERIINEQQFARRPAHALHQDFKNARIGLGDALMPRNHSYVELAQERIGRRGKREFLVREIAERMHARAPRLQPPQQLYVLFDRAPSVSIQRVSNARNSAA